MESKHFSHIHGLILHQVPQGSEIICSGCNFPGTGSVYMCWQCRFFLHENCFKASRSMNHPSHPSHPLNLFPYPTYPSNSFFCNSCNLVGTGFSYSCSNCEFDLHVHCTFLPTTNILEPPLSVPQETLSFDPQQHAYMPQTATTNIPEPSDLSHPVPNEMPTSDPQHVHIYRPQTNPIPNKTMSFSPQVHAYMPQTDILPNETTSFTPQPHVYMPQTDPIPNETKYFSPQQHAYMPQTDPTPNELTSFIPQQHAYIPQTATLNDPNLNYPPRNETDPSFSTPVPEGYPTSEAFLSKAGTNSTKTRGTKHFSHSHPLHLSEVAEEDYITCSGCQQDISGSSYSCTNSDCSFYLHKTCYALRQEICHKSHPDHPLTLLSSPPYEEEYNEFTCNACFEIGTAFTYHCSTCKFNLHVTCASLPETVKREDHEHALVLLYTSPITEQMREENPDISLGCDVCKRGVDEGCWVYNCKQCNYGTHLSCVNSEEISEEVALAEAAFNAQASLQRLPDSTANVSAKCTIYEWSVLMVIEYNQLILCPSKVDRFYLPTYHCTFNNPCNTTSIFVVD